MMETLLQALSTIGLGLLTLLALMVGITTQRLLRLRWQGASSHPVAHEAVPEAVRRQLDQGVAPLQALGFAYSSSGAASRILVGPDDSLQYYDVYRHADGHTHAMVSPSPIPESHRPCLIQMVTCLTNGNNWTTLNCSRHFAPFDFPRWPVFDDYLPSWEQAWQRHLQRVQFAQSRICSDSAEVQRRIALSFEKLIPALAQQGKLLPSKDGGYYRFSVRAALRYAVDILVGQLRAAWALRGQTVTPPPSLQAGDAVQADLRAFATQRALLQSAPASARHKWLVFAVSALLFLLVGGWVMSWSFVPIVLGVVALHEGGHYLAMKLTGYRNLSVFFLPGLGGAATGEKLGATPWEKTVVYLAGPVPGIVLAGLAFWLARAGYWSAPDWLNQFLIASLVINYLNLLPLVPLDGGRVMELLVFARHPRLRFAFAVLCCAVIFGAGIWLDDTVLRVVAILIALGLPSQWRRMQLDPLVMQDITPPLDEPTALQRVFTALQQPRFSHWSYAQRSTVATALLPELMGRRARAVEVAGGLLVYAACLLGPVGGLLLAIPQLGPVLNVMAKTAQIPPDDVTPEPPGTAASAPVDWAGKLPTVNSLAPQAQLAVYLGAAQQAADAEDNDAALRHYLSAWSLAQNLPLRDLRRIDTLEGLASLADNEAQRQAYLRQILGELEQPVGAERLRVAAAKEQLAYTEPLVTQRVTLLREALLLRKVGLGTDDALASTRLQLARALDEQGDAAEAQAQLRARLGDLPLPAPQDRSRAALHQRTQRVLAQTDLTWFLIAHDRLDDAQGSAAQALQMLPATITVSWIHPQQQALEAALWSRLLAREREGLSARWDAYDAARRASTLGNRKLLVHEADRALVAQALQTPGWRAQAQAAIKDSRAQDPQRPLALCQPSTDFGVNWRAPQRAARQKILAELGACAEARSPSPQS